MTMRLNKNDQIWSIVTSQSSRSNQMKCFAALEYIRLRSTTANDSQKGKKIYKYISTTDSLVCRMLQVVTSYIRDVESTVKTMMHNVLSIRKFRNAKKKIGKKRNMEHEKCYNFTKEYVCTIGSKDDVDGAKILAHVLNRDFFRIKKCRNWKTHDRIDCQTINNHIIFW